MSDPQVPYLGVSPGIPTQMTSLHRFLPSSQLPISMFSKCLTRHLSRRILPAVRFYSEKPRVGIPQCSGGDTAGYGDLQKSKPLNPHLNPHLSSHTCTNDPETHIPKVGVANAPPELISAVEAGSGEPENLRRMTGEFLNDDDSDVLDATGPGLAGSFGGGLELGVGEMKEAKFRIKPLRRQGEDLSTMRARLLCINRITNQSRKRGILETDLLLSTFADAHLPSMTLDQLKQYDLFLDENDWDIYYWTTQNPPTGGKASETALAAPTTQAATGQATPQSETTMQGQGQGIGESFGEGPVGEWAQTVGRVKEPYRPPPSRWGESEILVMLRNHVRKSAGKELRGLGRMPDVRQF